MNPFDIVRRTPKTNCGRCGYAACLAFASAVARGGEEPGKCPFLDQQGLVLPSQARPLEELAEQRDLELVEQLKAKIAPLSFAAIAPPLGCRHEGGAGGEALLCTYLGQKMRMTKSGILLDERPPQDPRDQILLYNYVHSRGGEEPAQEWVGMESLPNSISKTKTLATYCEERLAALFAEQWREAVLAACTRLGGRIQTEHSADLAVLIPVLPRLPHCLLFWQAEPEEGFNARVKVLFDRRVLDFLDLESLVFAAERLADRLALLLAASPTGEERA
jgi:hypothetical protein